MLLTIPGAILRSTDVMADDFCGDCVPNGKMIGLLWMSFSDSWGEDGLWLKLMILHDEPSCELLSFFCCHPCKQCWLLYWFGEQEELSKAKWEACMDCKADSSSGSVIAIDWGPQEWDNTLCATELGFLNILQIAHESCLIKENYENNGTHRYFLNFCAIIECSE